MAKHSPAFKREVVDAYFKGRELGVIGMGVKRLAAHYGIARTQVRYWVALFEMHGQAGLDRRPNRKPSAEFKLEVLERMWKENLSLTQATVLFNIRDPSVVAAWERLYKEGGITSLIPKPRGRRPAMNQPPEPRVQAPTSDEDQTREELLKENARLRAEVAYLKKLDALVQAKKPAQRIKRGSCSN